MRHADSFFQPIKLQSAHINCDVSLSTPTKKYVRQIPSFSHTPNITLRVNGDSKKEGKHTYTLPFPWYHSLHCRFSKNYITPLPHLQTDLTICKHSTPSTPVTLKENTTRPTGKHSSSRRSFHSLHLD